MLRKLSLIFFYLAWHELKLFFIQIFWKTTLEKWSSLKKKKKTDTFKKKILMLKEMEYEVAKHDKSMPYTDIYESFYLALLLLTLYI